MAEKAQVRVVTIRGDHFLHQGDVARLILECAEHLPDADARSMVRELASNIMQGKNIDTAFCQVSGLYHDFGEAEN